MVSRAWKIEFRNEPDKITMPEGGIFCYKLSRCSPYFSAAILWGVQDRDEPKFWIFFFLIFQLLPYLFTWLMSRAYFLGSCHHLLCFTDRVVKDCMLVVLLWRHMPPSEFFVSGLEVLIFDSLMFRNEPPCIWKEGKGIGDRTTDNCEV